MINDSSIAVDHDAVASSNNTNPLTPSSTSIDSLAMANTRHLEILQELYHQQIEKYYYNLRDYVNSHNKSKYHHRTQLIPTPSNQQYYSSIISKLIISSINAPPSTLSKKSKEEDIIIPIRLEIESDGYRLFDCFLWRLNPSSLSSSSSSSSSSSQSYLSSSNISIEEFAQITCMDFDIPSSIFLPLICRSIRDQIGEYLEYLKTSREVGPIMKGWTGLIRLDIIVGLLHLSDQFEWSLEEEKDYRHHHDQNQNRNQNDDNSFSTISPELFTEIYVKELALSSEFIPLIIHNIREQVYLIKRAFVTIMDPSDPDLAPYLNYYNYLDDSNSNNNTNNNNISNNGNDNSSNVNDSHTNHGHSKSNKTVTFSSGTLKKREHSKLAEFTPVLTELDVQDLEKIEQNREREARRKRRQQSKPANISATTGMSGIGSTITSNAMDIRTSGSSDGSRMGSIPSYSSRRAMAAANLTINTSNVNNIASENIVSLLSSPPKTLCTPLSYRGSLHRHSSSKGVMMGGGGDDDDEPANSYITTSTNSAISSNLTGATSSTAINSGVGTGNFTNITNITALSNKPSSGTGRGRKRKSPHEKTK